MESRQQLRQRLRQRRRALTRAERSRAALRLCQIMMAWPPLLRARRLAAYWPMDGELDPRPLIDAAVARGKQVYLPVLRPFGPARLWFVRYTPGQRMRPNRYRIPEPQPAQPPVSIRALDLVLAPLVAFDERGNRLGMGGGYYDRTFTQLRPPLTWQRPMLIGIAYAWQRLDSLPSAPWDVPLAAVATEQGLIRPRNDTQ